VGGAQVEIVDQCSRLGGGVEWFSWPLGFKIISIALISDFACEKVPQYRLSTFGRCTPARSTDFHGAGWGKNSITPFHRLDATRLVNCASQRLNHSVPPSDHFLRTYHLGRSQVADQHLFSRAWRHQPSIRHAPVILCKVKTPGQESHGIAAVHSGKHSPGSSHSGQIPAVTLLATDFFSVPPQATWSTTFPRPPSHGLSGLRDLASGFPHMMMRLIYWETWIQQIRMINIWATPVMKDFGCTKSRCQAGVFQ